MKMNRRQFITGGAMAAVGALTATSLVGCGESASTDEGGVAEVEKVVFVWEPNESTTAYDGMRAEVAACIEQGAGVPCEVMTTTDYNVTIESLASGEAQMASLGASEYVEVHAKNPAVGIAFVLSNEEGELDQASYYAQICVKRADAEKYLENGEYVLKDLEGKNFSYVSLESTSGFVIPATSIKNLYNLESTDELSESGSFFETVLFPGSHPGSLYNLLSGDADFAVFADYLTNPFLEIVEGEASQPGCVYRVLEGQDAPLDTVAGEEFVVIESYAVPAVPICVNTEALPAEMIENIIAYMTGDEVANNSKIFPDPDDTETVSNWTKTTDKVRFVRADDSYYDDFREMIDFQG